MKSYARSFLRIVQTGAPIPETVLSSFRAYAGASDDPEDDDAAALRADFAAVLKDIDEAQADGRVWCAVVSEAKEAVTAFRSLCIVGYGLR